MHASSNDHGAAARRGSAAGRRPSRFALSATLALALCACSSADEETAAPPAPVHYPELDRQAAAASLLDTPDWYRHAIFYELYVRSFQDSDGDGIGDLPGLVSRLDELAELGVDALWLMPIMPTPFADSGYDVSDYQDVNPDYGTLDDFDTLLAEAHARGIRVTIDLVLNHTSDEHAWFVESRSSQDNPKADWYLWSDEAGRADIGCGTVGDTFGESAWEYVAERDQYYYHRFYPGQPDLNYRNPEVVAATLDAARFWLERGVDGFRCDVIALLVESAEGCEMEPETVGYIEQLRALLDDFPDRAMVAESTDVEDVARYFGGGDDMFHMAFNFAFGWFWGFHVAGGDSTGLLAPFAHAAETYPAGAQDALVIGSHDVGRAYAVAQRIESRWRRAAFVQMTMPGTPFLYYGEELAMRPGTGVVVDYRDSARTPMLWSSEPGHGFTTGEPWIPFGEEADLTSLEVEKDDPASTWSFYRSLLSARRGREAFGTGTLRILETDSDAVALYLRESSDESYVAAVSLDETEPQTATAAAAELPGEAELLLGEGVLSRAGAAATVTLPPAGFALFRVR